MTSLATFCENISKDTTMIREASRCTSSSFESHGANDKVTAA